VPSRPHRALRARTHILVLILACLLPMLGLATITSERLAETGRQASEAQILSTVRALAAAVDVKLKTGAAQLGVLATTQSMREGDFEQVYQQSVEIARLGKMQIILADPDGKPIFNTRLPFGDRLAPLTSGEFVRLSARTRTVQVTDLFVGITSNHPKVSVNLPVLQNDVVTHVLLMSFDMATMSAALLEQHLPARWTVAVTDRNNRILARDSALEIYGGQSASAAFVAQAAAADEGVFADTGHDGTPLLTAFTTSAYSGWKVSLGIPLAEIEAPYHRSLHGIAWAAGIMLLLGILVAWLVGRRMAQSMRLLSSSALALGTGTPMALALTPVREIDDVVLALHAAEDLLRQRAQQRDHAEFELRRGEERFRDIAEISADWAWETGPDFRFTYHRGDTGGRERLKQANVIGRTRWELCQLDPESDPSLAQHQRDLEAHLPFRQVRMVTYADGTALHLSISGRPFFDEAGRFQGYRGVTTDETAMVLASQRAEQAEALLHDAIESIAAGLTIFDADDRLVIFNSGNNELYGADLGLQCGMSFAELVRLTAAKGHYVDAVGREQEWVAARVAQHLAATGSTEQRVRDGRWLLVTERRMRSGGIVSLRVDITALKQAQAAQGESEARLELAQATAKIGSWEIDLATGRYLWSKEMYRLRGMQEDEEPRLDVIIETTHPDDRIKKRQWLERLKAGGEPGAFEFRIHRCDNGEERIIRGEGMALRDAGGAITRIAGTLHDVTEFRRTEQRRGELERQLLHSQKLEALGTLASGIAHDLNNTLVPVITMAKLGLNAAAPDSQLHQDFALIYEAGKRARDLVKQVLAYSRKEILQPRRFRLDAVLSEALAMLRPTIPAMISLDAGIAAVPEIFGDPGQFHQVILNLVTNAVQAIDGQLGSIAISLAALPPGVHDRPDGRTTIRFTVRDTGRGMTPETKRRIFEPFFTTKPVGEGTGLGLAVAHGIVASHGGTIAVDSTAGRGTIFTVDLPAAAAETAADPAAPHAVPPQQRIRA
jgi:PAS domain S-box-containing protein